MVVVARRKDLLDALAERITRAGGEAIAMPCDISDLDAPTRWWPTYNSGSAASTS